ncbi:MAG: DUF4365 domain-containing protein [Planctomycetes bacterium]|nr:DUF4365 domain-containing protein [Planctomycetota bacterium]
MAGRKKRRTREHVIADLSVNHVERFILRCGWVARRMSPDYGIDLYMETYNSDGEIENEGVWFQLKATDKLSVRNTRNAIPVRMEWRDLLFWMNERMPGVLVIYDAKEEQAWWLHLQEAIGAVKRRTRDRVAATITLHVPLDNKLDETAIRGFAKLRDAALRGG